MNSLKNIPALTFMLFSMQSFATDLSFELQKRCANEQLIAHKAIKGHAFQSDDFRSYCKCEADFVFEKASRDQLEQFNKNKNANPNWLKQLKSKALNICVEKGRGITT